MDKESLVKYDEESGLYYKQEETKDDGEKISCIQQPDEFLSDFKIEFDDEFDKDFDVSSRIPMDALEFYDNIIADEYSKVKHENIYDDDEETYNLAFAQHIVKKFNAKEMTKNLKNLIKLNKIIKNIYENGNPDRIVYIENDLYTELDIYLRLRDSMMSFVSGL